jgi:predicted esterase
VSAVDRHRSILSFVLVALGFLGCAAPSDTSDDAEGAPVESTGTTANALAADVTVYGDAVLTQPWQNWGWSSTVNTNDTTAPLASGSKSQLKTTLTNAWGALSLARTSGDLPTATYDSVTFDIRSDRSALTSKVYLSVQSVAGGATAVQLPVPVTTSWAHHAVSLDNVRGNLASFGKVSFMGEKAGDVFYLDNVQFVAKGTSGTIPTEPVTPAYETVVTRNSWLSPYFLYVPRSYDATHRTPAKLLVWMHGCGGNGYGDAWSVSPGGSQSWITVSLGGRDGACWDMEKDPALVMAALDDVKKHLNIDPRKAVVGGYSSGGDLAYRTAFFNALSFAGVIADNTSPFRDTASGAAYSISAAAWRFNVAHLAHLQDYVYPIDGVRQETEQLKNAGFPLERIERNGQHWDDDKGSYGTMADRRTYLLPYLDRGWVAPAR